MDRVLVCSRCRRMILNNSICSNCLNKIDVVEIDKDALDIRLIEYTRSMINNELLGLLEIRLDDISIRVFGKIDKPSPKFKVKEWSRLEFAAI